jgi:hypothetical protein
MLMGKFLITGFVPAMEGESEKCGKKGRKTAS